MADDQAGIRPALWIDTSVVTADDLIRSITPIAFVDADGTKVNAIAVEYKDEIVSRGTALTADDFEVEVYDTINSTSLELGENPGAVTRVYINDKAAVSSTGTDRGTFVIIEVNTDYQRGNVPNYTSALAAGVKQNATLSNISGVSILPGDFVRNYTVTEREGRNGRIEKVISLVEGAEYEITNIADYQLFTIEDDTAFHATGCQEEALDGEGAEQKIVDVDVPYALYVPEGYAENPNGNWGLALQIEDAGSTADGKGCRNGRIVRYHASVP